MMPYTGYALISIICVLVGLVAFGKIKEKAYPYVLFGIGATMVLMTTLSGPNLVGSDIHLDYYYAQLRNGVDVWAPLIGQPQGTSVLAYITDWIWAYKGIYPLLFCLTPIIMYFIFRRWIDHTRAFLGSFFFIAFPIFFMELPTIPKQMVAELCLMGSLLLCLVGLKRGNRWIYLPIGGLVALVPLIHYSVGIMGSIIFGVGLILALVWRNKLWKPLLVSFLAIIIASSIYFPLAENGAVAKKVGLLYNNIVPEVLQINIPPPDSLRPPPEPPTEAPDGPSPKRYEQTFLSGVGLDFFNISLLGKLFRVLQWIIIVGLILGLWKLKRNKEFLILGGGFILIAILMVLPEWSNILNASRITHISLLMLSLPITLSLKPKYLACILLPYFIFTSGLVFEATKQPNLETLTVPYNVGLSDHRMDLGATLTVDDGKVRDYIIENDLFPLTSDLWGAYFMIQKIGDRPDINRALPRQPQDYIFVRSRNVQDGTFTIWSGIGLRRFVTPENYGIDWNENIIYQSGDARVIFRGGGEE